MSGFDKLTMSGGDKLTMSRFDKLSLCETHCEQFTAVSKDTTSRVVLGEIGCVKNADDLPADAAILH